MDDDQRGEFIINPQPQPTIKLFKEPKQINDDTKIRI